MTAKEKMQAYLKWCREHSLPAFVPESNICFHCHRPIFEDGDKGPKYDSFPTSCPHCHTTYCD